MAKKNVVRTPGYTTTNLTPAVMGPVVIASELPVPTTCQSCGHYHDEEVDPKTGAYGECRLIPPHHPGDHLTRRGVLRRYALVLATTPSCGGYRPR